MPAPSGSAPAQAAETLCREWYEAYGIRLDTAEAAQILRVSEGSVRTRLWRALGKLREVLAP